MKCVVDIRMGLDATSFGLPRPRNLEAPTLQQRTLAPQWRGGVSGRAAGPPSLPPPPVHANPSRALAACLRPHAGIVADSADFYLCCLWFEWWPLSSVILSGVSPHASLREPDVHFLHYVMGSTATPPLGLPT